MTGGAGGAQQEEEAVESSEAKEYAPEWRLGRDGGAVVEEGRRMERLLLVKGSKGERAEVGFWWAEASISCLIVTPFFNIKRVSQMIESQSEVVVQGGDTMSDILTSELSHDIRFGKVDFDSDRLDEFKRERRLDRR